jgi:hypothetical protein
MRRRFGVLLALLLAPAAALAQAVPVADIQVNAGSRVRTNVPVTASLANLNLKSQVGGLRLYETTGGRRTAIPAQIRGGNPDQLAFILRGETPAGATRTFALVAEPGTTTSGNAVAITDDGDDLRIAIQDKPVLEYRYTPMPVPAGVDEIFSLSGFIHPLWSPKGEVLSRIQAPDHYHHYGIWNPWTLTEFEGRTVDFWNIGTGQGRVRSQGVIEKSAGDVFGGFRAVHEHVDNTGPSGPRVAMREQWDVTVWNVAPDAGVWLIDFASTLSPATDQPLTIKAYRYQGFSLRATEKWHDSNSRLLTSEGLDKSTANATRARWIDVNGDTAVPEGSSGVLFMTNPANYNYPEQLRIWPTGQNGGTSNVYINFNPAQDRDWNLEPGRTYGLRYRMLVYDGRITPADAERHWNDYADPPSVEVVAAP